MNTKKLYERAIGEVRKMRAEGNYDTTSHIQWAWIVLTCELQAGFEGMLSLGIMSFQLAVASTITGIGNGCIGDAMNVYDKLADEYVAEGKWLERWLCSYMYWTLAVKNRPEDAARYIQDSWTALEEMIKECE